MPALSPQRRPSSPAHGPAGASARGGPRSQPMGSQASGSHAPGPQYMGNDFARGQLGRAGGASRGGPGAAGPDAARGDGPRFEANAAGPFPGWLNGALTAAFGQDLGGLDARFGQGAENKALGAVAHTEGRSMSFGAGADPRDLDELEVLVHETAHALAGGGSGQTEVDAPGDPGEQAAEQAASGFRRWAETGFRGPAPRLQPAFGGRARRHRVASGSVDGDPMLRYGSTGGDVEALQSLLNSRGSYGLVVDGIFGRKTDSAVRDWQASHGLEVDGIVGPKTAGSLNGSSSSSSSSNSSSSSSSSSSGSSTRLTGDPMLRKGDKGSLVSTLQGLLNGYGASLAVDGDFGSKTDQAVRGFQSANGLEVDGVVGPKTAAKLYDNGAKDVSSGSTSSSESGGSYAGNGAYDDMRDAVLAAARSHLGAPYYWGADGPSMFDCSGFVLYVLRQDTGLINWGDDTAAGIKSRLPSTNNPQPGDLNFYTGSSGVSHVEMYTGSGTTEIGASGGGSSTYGNDPNAKVQYSDSSADSRSLSHGSIQGLIDAKR